jgi:hypothetical protein
MVTEVEQHTTELAYRESDGIEVSLLWSPADDSLTVVCVDGRAEVQFAVAAEPSNALDVFHHPYAYAARQHVGYRSAECVQADALVA